MRFFAPKRIYMDYASAPPVSEAALRAMREAEKWIGNPGAIHAEGVQAAAGLSRARERIAALLGVKAREIIFTSGLTESNNIAIVGHALSLERKRRTLSGTHWIVSAIEHTSVLDCFAEIERLGGSVTHIQPDSDGRIAPQTARAALRPETALVSIGWANNEIGTIQPLAKIRAEIDAHEREAGTTVLLHSDAGQAPLYLRSTAHSLGVDLLSIGGNKLYGPHGVGALYISNRAEIIRVAQGGPQERKLRPGTESVALALGFAAAYEEVAANRGEAQRIEEIRDSLARELESGIDGIVINGDLALTLPHMLSVSIPGIQSEYITLALDRVGIAVSTKSACREGEESASHVVASLGGDSWRAHNTLRISIGTETTPADAKRLAGALIAHVNRHPR